MVARNGKKPLSEALMLGVYYEDARGRQTDPDKAVHKVRVVTNYKGKVVEKTVTPVRQGKE